MLVYLISILSLMATNAAPMMNGTIIINVENIQSAKGQIRIGVFNKKEGFPADAHVFKGLTFPVNKKGSMTIRIDDLPYGEYAIAAHHDIKMAGKMSRNLFGVPSEPYGFSNGAIAKWGDPNFSDASFSLNSSEHKLSITIKPWSAY